MRSSSTQLDKLLNQEISVNKDGGFVAVSDYLGNENTIVNAARVSYANNAYGSGDEVSQKDEKLIEFLLKNGHWSPFEMPEIQLVIQMPIFVARQWFRHTHRAVNEVSARYTRLPDSVFIPSLDRISGKSKTNKQGSGEELPLEVRQKALDIFEKHQQNTKEAYDSLIELGVAEELARTVQTVGQHTKFIWKQNLRDLLHLCRLRLGNGAQKEIQEYGSAIMYILAQWCPITVKAFEEHYNL